MRKQIAAANWKMNLSLSAGEKLIEEILAKNITLSSDQLALFALPFPYLIPFQKTLESKDNYFVAAQNLYSKKSGAFTGEVSAEMLTSINIKYVIIGHSERREYFIEDNKVLADKIDLCLANSIKPIFCCGEALPVREAETQNDFVAGQLAESLFHLTADQLTNFIIAYEPIWAIGTGKTASAEQAQQMHEHIRTTIAGKYGKAVADSVSILYGGSVKASNASEIFSQPDVDGGLVGGASLISEEFGAVISALKN